MKIKTETSVLYYRIKEATVPTSGRPQWVDKAHVFKSEFEFEQRLRTYEKEAEIVRAKSSKFADFGPLHFEFFWKTISSSEKVVSDD